MSKSSAFESDILKLIFNATPISHLADNAASSPFTNLYVSLHTADPGPGGVQTTNEANYTGYARVAVARTSGGWSVSGANPTQVNPVAAITFPLCTGGSNTITNWAIGTSASGSTEILYSGTVSPNIAVTNGVTPQLTTASTITEQ